MQEKPGLISEKLLDSVLQELESAMLSRPERPKEGEPIRLTDEELAFFQERGQILMHWRDGTMTWLLSNERKAELEKMFK